jgi:pimeloyl-ACP methyl ester carboxylesterase
MRAAPQRTENVPRLPPALLACTAAAALAACMPPSWGANALLHPARRPVGAAPALAHRDLAVDAGDGVTLRGWLFPAAAAPRAGTVVYLHGVADNRASGVWLAERLVPHGFDVVVYDGRAHGESTGDACTYGFLEKRDLSRVLDRLGVDRAIVVGVSLGAAVALQAAPEDPRIAGVVSVATFSSLDEIARVRVGKLASEGQIREALALSERQGRFRVGEVSPIAAAPRIRAPVLVVYGDDDQETPPDESLRVYAALAGPKQLATVRGAGHDDALPKAWPTVEAWLLARAEQPPQRDERRDEEHPAQ